MPKPGSIPPQCKIQQDIPKDLRGWIWSAGATVIHQVFLVKSLPLFARKKMFFSPMIFPISAPTFFFLLKILGILEFNVYFAVWHTYFSQNKSPCKRQLAPFTAWRRSGTKCSGRWARLALLGPLPATYPPQTWLAGRNPMKSPI